MTLSGGRATGLEGRVTHFDNFHILVTPTLETTRYLKGKQEPRTFPYACNLRSKMAREKKEGYNLVYLVSFCQLPEPFVITMGWLSRVHNHTQK